MTFVSLSVAQLLAGGEPFVVICTPYGLRFSDMTQLEAESDCTPCVAGSYCETVGLTSPTAECVAGSYCTLGASTPAPRDGTMGDICPAGMYCVVGSTAGTQ